MHKPSISRLIGISLFSLFSPVHAIASQPVASESITSEQIVMPTEVREFVPNSHQESGLTTELEVYGSFFIRQFDYFKNAQDINPRQRREIDLERVSFEPKFKFGKHFAIETEIEIEHGGTGTSMEFDGFEEFGEFETEIEQGGEVKLDKLEIKWMPTEATTYKTGFITVPVGLISQKHKPTDFFTVTRNRSESRLLPSTWRSVGIGASGNIELTQSVQILHQTVLVQGLNSEFFRKYNWIQGGAARRFETTYADSLALATRWDIANSPKNKLIGASGYYGNSSGNRHKVDKLTVEANVLTWDVHGFWESPTWTIRGLYLNGILQNSDEVSAQNSNLSGGANPKQFAALGKEAELYFLEIGFNLYSLFGTVPEQDVDSLTSFSPRYDVYLRYDSLDPMKRVTGTILRDPRFAETAWTAGLSYRARPELVAKFQYTKSKSGLSQVPEEQEFLLGIGFYFSNEFKN